MQATIRRALWLLGAGLLLAALAPVPGGPVRAAPAGPSHVRQAFFYTIPRDGTPAETIARTSHLVILTRRDEGFRDAIRAAGYGGMMLQYVLPGELEGPQTATSAGRPCDAGYRPRRNQVSDEAGVFCRVAHPNEDWFLHNGGGERLYDVQDGRSYYQMNPASEGWRSYALAQLRTALAGDRETASLGYDGLFLDNIAVSLVKAQTQLRNSDGAVREYADDGAFQEAWLGLLRQLSDELRPRWPLWGNLISTRPGQSWHLYLGLLDGAMHESFVTSWGAETYSPEAWAGSLARAEEVLGAGKGFIAVTRGADDGDQPFALGSFLLVTDGRNATFRYTYGGDYGRWLQYANYGTYLGPPIGLRYQLPDGSWRRDFRRGYVVVDPFRRAAAIVTRDELPLEERIVRQTLPGAFEAEDFAGGGEGSGYGDTTPWNIGGAYRGDGVDLQRCGEAEGCYNVGWVEPGEWLAYGVRVLAEGDYTVTLRVATPLPDQRLHLEVDGVDVSGPLTIAPTGAWDSWADATFGPVRLPAGEHTLRIVFDTGLVNLDDLVFQLR